MRFAVVGALKLIIGSGVKGMFADRGSLTLAPGVQFDVCVGHGDFQGDLAGADVALFRRGDPASKPDRHGNA